MDLAPSAGDRDHRSLLRAEARNRHGLELWESEDELGKSGLSSFRTPTLSDWDNIKEKCIEHLARDRSVSSLPHANKIWMLYGFELFTILKNTIEAELIEVYPYAIIRALLPECEHKSTNKGYTDQLNEIALHTGWVAQDLELILKGTVAGSRHDRLDAFMAAWVASMSAGNRFSYGDPSRENDSIWVPRLS